jgi:NAD-dependent deacetylase sirtuin 4
VTLWTWHWRLTGPQALAEKPHTSTTTRSAGMGVIRIPYTDPLPAPRIIPAYANTISGAINALSQFLLSSNPSKSRASGPDGKDGLGNTLLLTGAGISVASGLADYRGTNGTYTLNKTYRPIYFHEFCASHQARKRYWARSFLGWANLVKAKPNRVHYSCGKLGELGLVRHCITQSQCS